MEQGLEVSSLHVPQLRCIADSTTVASATLTLGTVLKDSDSRSNTPRSRATTCSTLPTQTSLSEIEPPPISSRRSSQMSHTPQRRMTPAKV